MLNVSFKFLLLLCFILINPLLGTPLLKLEKEIHYLYNNCFYYIGNVNTFKNISWKNCKDIRKKVLNFGYQKEPVWIKFTIENHNPDLNIYIIKLSTPALDSLQIYINSNLMEVCGDHFDYHSRNIPTNECYYKLYINYKEKKDIILKYQSTSNILIPVVFYSEKEFIKNQYYSSFLHGAIIGSFVILFIYHLFFSISSRIKYFYYFSIYIFVTTCLSYSLINGRSLFFNFIPYYIFDKANAFFAFLTTFFALTFIYSFLNLNNYPIIKKIYLYFNYIGSIIFILLLLLPTRIYNQYTNILILIYIFLVIYFTTYSIFKKIPYARFVLITWTPLYFTSIMVIFRLLGYTEFSYWSTYLLILGFVFEKTLLSIIIGRYFYKSELNKKLLDNEFQIASKTQKFLLPANVPSNERIQFSWFYSPKLEVGGDFFDLYYKDNKYYILLMDVAGHGISGSMIASMVKIIFDKYKTIPKVSKILNLIRKSLIGKIGNLFITGIFLEIDLKNMSLSVHMAGHEPLYLIQKNKFQKIKLHGKPIAEYYDMDLEKSIISINKNDILFLYTDGLIELFNKQEELDIKKIINILEKNDFDIEKTNHEIQKIINKNKSKIDDDITYIFIKIK